LPAASLLKVIEQKPASKTDDNTFVMADVERKAITQSEGSRAGIVESPPFPHEAEELAEKLSTGTWRHDYPIFAAKPKELGLRSAPIYQMKFEQRSRTSGRHAQPTLS
jgi:hypothetical protein